MTKVNKLGVARVDVVEVWWKFLWRCESVVINAQQSCTLSRIVIVIVI